MLKRMILAVLATALVAAFALPVQFAPATAAGMSCKQAAKVRFASDKRARHAFKKECKAAWKSSQRA